MPELLAGHLLDGAGEPELIKLHAMLSWDVQLCIEPESVLAMCSGLLLCHVWHVGCDSSMFRGPILAGWSERLHGLCGGILRRSHGPLRNHLQRTMRSRQVRGDRIVHLHDMLRGNVLPHHR